MVKALCVENVVGNFCSFPPAPPLGNFPVSTTSTSYIFCSPTYSRSCASCGPLHFCLHYLKFSYAVFDFPCQWLMHPLCLLQEYRAAICVQVLLISPFLLTSIVSLQSTCMVLLLVLLMRLFPYTLLVFTLHS